MSARLRLAHSLYGLAFVVASLVPSISIWLKAKRDLAEMEAGRTDPRGERATLAARRTAALWSRRSKIAHSHS